MDQQNRGNILSHGNRLNISVKHKERKKKESIACQPKKKHKVLMVADNVNWCILSLPGDSDNEPGWKPQLYSIFPNKLSGKGTSPMVQIIPRMLRRGICCSKYSAKIITGRTHEKYH